MRGRGGPDARFPHPPLCRGQAARAVLAGGGRRSAAEIARPHLVAVPRARPPADLRGRDLFARLLACRPARPGVIPARTDPLIDSVSPGQADQAMAKLRETIAAMVPTLPTHAAYLRNLSRQFAR